MVSTVRIGMVGAGAVAARHVRTLLAMDGVELAAVADPALERAKELAAEAGAAVYPNHMELLAAERLDAVYICVPPFAHGAPELAVIDAGLPMFVEKPVAIDQETAAGIAARLAGRPLVTCTGYHWRWLDIFDRAAELLADRPAHLVQCSWLDKVPPPPWWLRRDGSGGQTIEQTTHVLDTARGLAGEVTEVHAFGTRAAETGARAGSNGARTASNPPPPRPVGPRIGRVADGGAEGARGSTAPVPGGPATPGVSLPAADIHDVSVAALRFASGAVGTVVSTCLLPRLQRAGVQVVGDGLSLELSETELVVEADGRRSVWEADADARPRPDRDFVAAVRGGPDRIRVPWPEAYRTHLLACAITRSAEEGRPLPVPTEGSGEPRRGAPVDREGSGEPRRGAPVDRRLGAGDG
jgi:myo-inositol 2-dehydrogenase / D-chiro-inositol 1-dehydrogenase